MSVVSNFIASRKKILIILLLVFSVFFPLIVQSGLIIRIAVLFMIYSLLSLGNMVITGYCGMLNVGHAAFYGVGAYVSALLSLHFGLPFLVCFIAAGVVAAVFGYLISIPCLRVQVDFLSLITLAFAQIFISVVTNWTSLTRGARGLPGIPSASILGFQFDTQERFYYLMFIIVVVVYVILRNLMASPIGRAMQALRDDEISARAVGINVNNYKILAFVIGSFIAGFAGSLMAHYLTFIGPTGFTLDISLIIMQMCILGGLGSLPGAVIGALFFTVMPEVIRPLAVYRLGMGGLIMVMVMLIRPQGILGSKAFAGKGGIFAKAFMRFKLKNNV